MKKSKLIKLLSEIKGDPEILLWNGLVGDWMDIDGLSEADLVKMKLDYYIESVRLEQCIDLKDWNHQLKEVEVKELKSIHRKFEYEHNDYVTDEDIQKKRYMKKDIVYIEAKKRGATMPDRLGPIEY